MALRVTKFGVAHYRHYIPLLRVDETNKPEILLRDKSFAHVLFVLKTFFVCEFDH